MSGALESVHDNGAAVASGPKLRRAFAELYFAIPSTESAVVSVVESIKQTMKILGVVDDWIFRAELALQEALLNGHIHGNRADSRKELRVACVLSAGKLEIHVEDDGEGFDLNRRLCAGGPDDPGGRGLFLMRQLMDSVTVGRKGNHIVMSLSKE